ncbi:3-oxo-5a-steroid 4- dehydrogenase [Tulasnella sp. 419]|nr:3-oxo-5a-steroid 4- dehydrogenase [Tulasnella sp. 419]
MVNITVKPFKPIRLAKQLPVQVTAQPEQTIASLKRSIQQHCPKFPVERQRIISNSNGNRLDDDTKIGDILGDTKDALTLLVKDLGPQIGWRTVFIIEYAGPLWIHPLLYYCPKLLWRKDFVHSDMQKFALALVLIHYVKRELESIFVHRFSSATMPRFNVFKNSAYYWGPSGVMLASSLYGPWFSKSALAGTLRDDPRWLWGLTAIWAFAELSNLKTHLTLRSLRPAGTRQKGIPTGYGFNLVSCPNYMFEVLGWLVFTAMTGSWAAVVFTIIGIVQMSAWGIKKHKAYRKDFGDKYPKNRNVIFPFIL